MKVEARKRTYSSYIKDQPMREQATPFDMGGFLPFLGTGEVEARRCQAMTLGAVRVVPLHYQYCYAPLNRHALRRVQWGPLFALCMRS